MAEDFKASEKEPLEIVACKIAEHANKSVEHIIKAAMLVQDARRRVEAGEAGYITWYEWAPKNIDLSNSRLRELQRIAAAEDPEKEIERLRRQNQKRVEKHRNKKAAEPDALAEERKQLIAWVKTAPISNVRHMLDMIPSKSRMVQPCALPLMEERHV